jgi:hypothetical protein
MGTTRYSFHLPLQTEEALRLFLHHAFGVSIPDVSVCPGHTSPWRAFADAYFARDRVSVWLASRGFGGKSFLLSLLGLTESLTLKCDVTILGGSGEQSKRVHEYMRRAWNHPHAPRQLLASDPSKWETTLTWGNTIRALLASQSSVRGPHPQRLRLDEVDEMELAILNAALGQPMSRDGVRAQTVLSSTHHHPDGTMSAVLKMAGEKGWPVCEWCYHETMEPHGWLSADEVEAKKTDVTQVMWDIEYELQQPSAEGRAVMPEAIYAMFDPDLGVYEGRDREDIEAEAPQPGASYQTGADWARKHDHTVIVTVRTDTDPMRVVAFERLHRQPWPQMVDRFERRLRRYPGRARHDGTGLGDVIASYLTLPCEDVLLVGRTRSDLFSDYINVVESGGIVSPDIRFMHHEHEFASVDDLYGSGHPPDSFVAAALAAVPSSRRRWLPIDDHYAAAGR